MAELSYREAVATAIAQEMARDENVVLLGEDVGAAGGVFKATVGLFERFGPLRVRDTPISEMAILGAAMGAAMTGLRPIAEIMFSDFLAVCWDMPANQMAKTRYMSGGQVTLPLVLRTANGGGLRFGAQHSQAVENWAMVVPGLEVVAPSTPADVHGLLAAAIRDPDPVMFFEARGAICREGRGPGRRARGYLGDGKGAAFRSRLHDRRACRDGPRALEAARQLAAEGIEATVVDVRSLVPSIRRRSCARHCNRSSVHRRGESAPLWLGCNRVDRGGGGVLGPRCAGIVRITHRTRHCRRPTRSRITFDLRRTHRGRMRPTLG